MKKTENTTDPRELRSVLEHPLVEKANDHIGEIDRQFGEVDCDLGDLQREHHELEMEMARSYVPGEPIPAALEDEMDEIGVRMDGLRQQLRVLEAAREKAVEDRTALIEELREEIAEDLRERYAEAIKRLHAVLCDAARVNEEVKRLEEAARRLCGRTYGGAGTENTAGIGTGGGSMLIPVSPLPDLAWKELSIRTTPTQSTTRLLHWTEFANKALGLDLEKPEIE